MAVNGSRMDSVMSAIQMAHEVRGDMVKKIFLTKLGVFAGGFSSGGGVMPTCQDHGLWRGPGWVVRHALFRDVHCDKSKCVRRSSSAKSVPPHAV